MENIIVKVGLVPDGSIAAGAGRKPVFYRLTYDDIKEDPLKACGKRAVMASLKGHGSVDNVNLEHYSITYVYTDSDGDDILIDSEAGLRTALDEAKDASKLKLLANVKRVGGTSMSYNSKPAPVVVAAVAAVDSQNPPAVQTTVNSQRGFFLGPNQPFIHGRHQCSGCLDLPIIGARFHGIGEDGSATNLCETCHDEYTGSVQYSPVELDADLNCQKQFRRQHRFKYRAVVHELKEQRQGACNNKKLARAAAKAGRELHAKTAGLEAPVVVQADRSGGSDGGGRLMTLGELQVKAKRQALRELAKKKREGHPGNDANQSHSIHNGTVPTLAEIKAKRQHLRQLVQARAEAMNTLDASSSSLAATGAGAGGTRAAAGGKIAVGAVVDNDWQMIKKALPFARTGKHFLVRNAV